MNRPRTPGWVSRGALGWERAGGLTRRVLKQLLKRSTCAPRRPLEELKHWLIESLVTGLASRCARTLWALWMGKGSVHCNSQGYRSRTLQTGSGSLTTVGWRTGARAVGCASWRGQRRP